MAASEMDKYPILNPKKKLAYRSARNRIDWIDAGYSCLFFKCRTSKTSFLVFFFSLIFYAITQKLYDNDDDHHHHCCLYSIVFMDKYFFTLKKIITLNLDYRTNIFLFIIILIILPCATFILIGLIGHQINIAVNFTHILYAICWKSF